MGWTRFFHRSRWDEERRRELESYLELETDDNIARGMSPAEARRAAHRALGNPTLVREEIFQMNTMHLLDSLWNDLRHGLRLLRRNPTFSLVAILTLALGTGANAAIFQLVNAVRLRTLPVERPQELVSIGIDDHGKGRVGRRHRGRSIHTEPLWRELQARQEVFSALLAWGSARFDLSTHGEYRPAEGLFVSGGYFDALGVKPHAGRLFTEANDQKGCGAPGAVLSYGFWQARYGGEPSAVGQTISLNRRPFEIVGVTPPGFFGVEVGRAFDIAVPICADPLLRIEGSGVGQAHVSWLDVMGRLRPGRSLEAAQAHLAAISPAAFDATVSPTYNAEVAGNYRAFTFTASSAARGVSSLRTQYATELWILFGVTGLVLLITCANLANLMLARATAREREVAVRLAMGASRGRVVRQMLAESLLLASLGAAAGMFLAQWLSRALVLFVSTDGNPIFVDLAPDWRLFAFIAALATAACVLFGLSPALRATATNPATAMQAGGRSGHDGPEAFTLRRALVVAQVALSMVLVVGALLFGRTLWNLKTVDLGFRQDGVVVSIIDLRHAGIAPEGLSGAFDRVVAGIRGVPGVRHAAASLIVPMARAQWNGRVLIGGAAQDGMVNFNQVGDGYFAAMETPMLAGRAITREDRAGTPLVAVVNERFARRYVPGRSPIGEIFQMEAPPGESVPQYMIVGLTRDTKYLDVREEFSPIAYLALAQETRLFPLLDVIVRSDLPAQALAPALTRAILQAAPGAVVGYDTMAKSIREALVTERVMATLSGFFGLLAMLIATIGLYGVMSYMVTRRRAEIGIRLALGAERAAVTRMIVRDGAWLVGLGILAGTGLSLVAARSARTLLFGVAPQDPFTVLASVALLAAVGVMATYVPARRAARLDPAVALRDQ